MCTVCRSKSCNVVHCISRWEVKRVVGSELCIKKICLLNRVYDTASTSVTDYVRYFPIIHVTTIQLREITCTHTSRYQRTTSAGTANIQEVHQTNQSIRISNDGDAKFKCNITIFICSFWFVIKLNRTSCIWNMGIEQWAHNTLQKSNR